MTAHERTIETYSLKWHDYTITITFERHWLGQETRAVIGDLAHITLTESERRPLPITETGFRSIFVAPGEVNAAGGPVAFVREGLDDAARSEGWRAREAARRQLSLF